MSEPNPEFKPGRPCRVAPIAFKDYESPGPRPMVARRPGYLTEHDAGYAPGVHPAASWEGSPCPACGRTCGRCRTEAAGLWSDCWNSLGSKFDVPVRVVHAAARRVPMPRPRPDLAAVSPGRPADSELSDLRAEIAQVRSDLGRARGDVAELARELLALRARIGGAA